MQACPAPPTTQVVMGVAWALLTAPHLHDIMEVIAVVSALSAWCHPCCGCWCDSGCRSYCNPAHRNIISVLKLKEKKTIMRGTGRWYHSVPLLVSSLVPIGIIPGADWPPPLSPLPPWSHLGVGSCSHYCGAPHVVMVSVPFHMCSLCVNNCQ